MSRRLKGFAAMVAAVTMGVMMPTMARADLSYSLKGGTLTVTASPSLAGKGLKLLWNKTDDGDASVVSSWTNSADIVLSVPAEGGVYSIDLCACGITNGQPCKVASFTRYERLDMLMQNSYKSYVNTGIADSRVYGIRFGYYSVANSVNKTSTNPNYSSCIGTRGSGFVVHANGAIASGDSRSEVTIYWRGAMLDVSPSVRYANSASDAPDVAKINEFAFTNGVFTLNGGVVKSDLGSGVTVGTSGNKMFVGTSYIDKDVRAMCGWWSHVSFDDANGDKIIDYIPVKRVSDNVVGFYDRVSSSFKTSSNPDGSFSAGNLTGENVDADAEICASVTPDRMMEVSIEGTTLTVEVPASLVGEQLLVLWDDADMGDDVSAWAHSSVVSDQVPAGGVTHQVKLGRLGVRKGQSVCVAAANRFHPLDMLKQNSYKSYVNTGIADSRVYGIRFGYYSVANSGKSGNFNYSSCIGSGGSGFVVHANGAIASGDSRSEVTIYWRGAKLDVSPSVRYANSASDAPDVANINEFAFTNGVFTLNGGVVKSDLGSGVTVGTSGNNMVVGTSRGDMDYKAMYGWWSHVSFDDASGDKIIDYIPVKRASDDVVGFYDRVAEKFVTATSGGFSAGTVTNASPVVEVNSRRTMSCPAIPGLMIIVQ